MRLIVILLLLCTAACSSSPAAQQSCAGVEGFTCTTLRVPLDHRQPAGKTLDLAVVAADNVDAPRGVLLMLTGGPGQPGVGLLQRVRTYVDPSLLDQYRLVMMDQRGTGETGINCPSLQTAIGGSDFLTPPIDAEQDCARRLGQDRDYYGTPDTVDDIELLRQLLKQDRLTLDGTSYGSFTAGQYGLKYPNHVRSIVLDSVVPHGGINPFGVDLMAATGPVLAATCRQDAACTTDPVADLAWLVQHGKVSGVAMLESLSVLSLNAVNPSLRGIPATLHAAREGDDAGLKELLQQATSRDAAYDDLSAGLHLATFCSDLRFPWGTSATPIADRPAGLEAALARLTPAQLYPYDVATARNQLMVDGCLRWPPARASTYPAGQTLLPRTLILQGSNDLFCPAAWATWERDHAREARLVVVPGSGHGVQGSRSDPTGRNEVRDFLLSGG
jgi:pimeloyl-ACP methyl ester carboxylesterase